MTSRSESGEGVQTFMTLFDKGVSGGGEGSKCRYVMNSYYNQYDSVQSWLDFSYCSQAIRRLFDEWAEAVWRNGFQ